jgi:S-adenosylmethionine synthetase
MIKTCEFVSPKHPDKMCDLIADSILDAYLKKDKKSRVAIEVLGGHKLITITGEVKSRAKAKIKDIVSKIVGKQYEIRINLEQQSPFISQGVNQGGAGDQGIMVGYACKETKTFMPYEYELARNLCKNVYRKYPFDGKVQVTIEGKKVLTVIVSFQNTKSNELEKLVRSLIKAENYLINPAGEWLLGGFDADSGLSGRKIVIDAYGPQIPVGGGSFSGKDPTKVDRSGAYMARRIAIDLIQKYKADEVLVKLAYAIGKKEPVMALAFIDGKEISIPKKYDLSPQGIIKFLKLKRPIFAKTAVWGHFGRGFIWG